MTFIYIILCVAGGFCLCGAWFGLCALCSSVLKGRGEAARLAPLLAGVPFAAVLKVTAGFIPQNFEHAQNLLCAAAVLISVFASAAVVNLSTERRRLFGKELFWWALGGAFMEVPQRLFMQGALFAALRYFAVPNAGLWAVFCNGAVWCFGIIAQAAIAKQRPCKRFLRSFALRLYSPSALALPISKPEFSRFAWRRMPRSACSEIHLQRNKRCSK